MFGKKDTDVKKKVSPILPLASVHKPQKPKKTPPFIYLNRDPDTLIDVKKFQLPKVNAVVPDFEELDKLLQPLPIITEKNSTPENRDASEKGVSADSKNGKQSSPLVPLSLFSHKDRSSLAASIIGQRSGRAKQDATREKYENHNFPLPQSKKGLKRRIEPLLEVVPRLLAGEEDLSIFYNLAHEQYKSLPHLTMTSRETFEIPFQKYVAGYYGLLRQNFVSMLIQAKYGDLLRKSRNKTVLYWSPDMFATYVLANEIILRLVMEDMEMSKLQAESFLQKTADYGTYIADEIEFANDLDFDELSIIKKKPKGKKLQV